MADSLNAKQILLATREWQIMKSLFEVDITDWMSKTPYIRAIIITVCKHPCHPVLANDVVSSGERLAVVSVVGDLFLTVCFIVAVQICVADVQCLETRMKERYTEGCTAWPSK